LYIEDPRMGRGVRGHGIESSESEREVDMGTAGGLAGDGTRAGSDNVEGGGMIMGASLLPVGLGVIARLVVAAKGCLDRTSLSCAASASLILSRDWRMLPSRLIALRSPSANDQFVLFMTETVALAA
jgi:hypothetical protein